MPGITLYTYPLIGTLKIKTTLGGQFVSNGQKVIRVPWPNGGAEDGGSLLPSSQASGIGSANLRTQILAIIPELSATNMCDVVGHSGGAQNIMRCIREHGAEIQAAMQAAGKDLSWLRFWPLGCPEQKFTGASYLYPAQSPPIYPGDGTKCGGTGGNNGPHDSNCPSAYPSQHGGYGVGSGLPEPCPFTVNVVSNQWDGWSMAPTNMNHPALTKIYDVLLFVLPRKVWDHNPVCYMKSSTGPHGKYDTKDSKTVPGPEAFSYTDPANPTVKYWYIRTYPFPGFDKLWARFLKRNRDMEQRPSIDTAFAATDATHGMQISIPAPDYTAVASWFPL